MTGSAVYTSLRQALMKRPEGDEMASRFVRHPEKTTGGRFYDWQALLPAPITMADCGMLA
jgi:hypothetical protein